MTDLTLYEYMDLSEEELEQILKEEARIICGPDSLKDDLTETVDDLHPLRHSKHRKAETDFHKS